ncbi:uncharacterized protein LOC117114998 [Anneissia japonica]|uniref:uncharacterized protein LOC117114998 n=1 Tax=Anneissia japonica TaxID=1529436 RepID=UPI001425777E|nr:uncharacterized protein LOC117114998 [Anneissia japonica]
MQYALKSLKTKIKRKSGDERERYLQSEFQWKRGARSERSEREHSERVLQKCVSENEKLQKEIEDWTRKTDTRQETTREEGLGDGVIEEREKEVLKIENQKLREKLKTKSKLIKEQNKKTIQLNKLKIQNKKLKKQVEEREDQRLELEERIHAITTDQQIDVFSKGKYSNAIRDVYIDLLKMGVGINNVDKIVRTVLKKLLGMEASRLPQKSLASEMFLEARALAHLHIVDEVVDLDRRPEEVSNTLCSDGTSKLGHHYMAYDLNLEDGRALMLGLRGTPSGTAESTLDALKDIVDEVVSIDSRGREGVQNLVATLKNTMSDRCATQKKFNRLLEDYREEILPDVIEGWGDLSETEQIKVVKLDNYFCGLHFLVGLADQADASLCVWERLVLGDEKRGAERLVSLNVKSGESGAVRLIRTVCKSVQERACEKSGKPVQFRAFLASERGKKKVPLAPFKGNRFNIIFHNGAGVYALLEDLRIFFERVKNDNLLLGAVHADVGVSLFVCGARALGLIDKYVTGPLWKVTEGALHVRELSARYERMLNCFTRWSNDASGFLRGEERLFEDVPVRNDEVLEMLLKESEECDAGTIQALEIMFAFFKKSHRDYCLIFWKENDVGEWIDSLSPERYARVMEICVKSKRNQRLRALERKAEHAHEQRVTEKRVERQRM